MKPGSNPVAKEGFTLPDFLLPPIDVLIIWHSYLLNPLRAWEDSIRIKGKEHLLGARFPLESMVSWRLTTRTLLPLNSWLSSFYRLPLSTPTFDQQHRQQLAFGNPTYLPPHSIYLFKLLLLFPKGQLVAMDFVIRVLQNLVAAQSSFLGQVWIFRVQFQPPDMIEASQISIGRGFVRGVRSR